MSRVLQFGSNVGHGSGDTKFEIAIGGGHCHLNVAFTHCNFRVVQEVCHKNVGVAVVDTGLNTATKYIGCHQASFTDKNGRMCCQLLFGSDVSIAGWKEALVHLDLGPQIDVTIVRRDDEASAIDCTTFEGDVAITECLKSKVLLKLDLRDLDIVLEFVKYFTNLHHDISVYDAIETDVPNLGRKADFVGRNIFDPYVASLCRQPHFA